MSLPAKEIEKKKRQALKLLNNQRFRDARDIYQRLVNKGAADAATWFMLGTTEGRLGNLGNCEAAMRKSLELDPGLAEGWLGLGQALELQGKTDESCEMYKKALQQMPNLAEAYASLGRIYKQKSLIQQALFYMQKAIALGVNRPNVLFDYAEILRSVGRYRDALAVFLSLRQQFPDNAELLYKIGNIYHKLNEIEQAGRYFNESLKLDADNINAKLGLINISYLKREHENALQEISDLFDANMDNAAIPVYYAEICHLDGSCRKVIERLEKLLENHHIKATYERPICFALGHLYDQLGEYDKAFPFFKRGNDLKAGQYDPSIMDRTVSSIISGYNRDSMKKCATISRTGAQPLFIIGMPRSGTSLTDQILSSHPQIHGAGELATMDEILRAYRGEDHSIEDIAQEADAMEVTDLNDMALRYLDSIDALADDVRYVSDKMPSNYLRLGLIAMLFPNAKIVHVRRNPIDTCLSCYFHDFSGYHTYIYELESLAHRYKCYQRLMDHWRETLPIPMIEIEYEDLVAQPETEVRRMLDYLELEWNERCMQSHDSDHIIITASHAQVRDPIHNKSVSRWKNYEKFITPLIDGLA
jgi:tetratricopeptide (TPR) repeat protein